MTRKQWLLRRAASAVFALALMLTLLPVAAFATMEDTTPPVLHSLTLDKTTVEAPGTITFTANVSDDISGVATVMLKWDGKPSGATSNLYLYKTEQAGIYSGTLIIGQYEAARTQRVEQIYLCDNAGNGKWSPLGDGYSFTVTNSHTPDTTPPTLNSLTLDKTTVNAPGTVTITADVSDDLSGVDWIHITYADDQNPDITYGVYLDATGQAGKYSYIFEIGEYEPARTIQVKDISLHDIAGNRYQKDYTNEYAFTVSNSGTPDTTPPTLNTLTFDKATVEAPGTIKVIANVSDDISGVDTVMVWWDGQPSGATSNLYLYKTEQADIYSGTLTIGRYETARTQRVKEISLRDKAGNEHRVEYTNEYSFTVTRDTTPPILTAGTVHRTSDAAATVGFTTNEAGVAYYNIVERGASEAEITDVDTIKSFTSLGAVSAVTVTAKAVALTAGAKDIYVYVVDENDNYSTGLKIETAAYIASGDATLSVLTLNAGTLSPAFDTATTSYTASVANSVNNITISATANEEHATISGTGGKALSVGSNIFNIVVTAEDSTTTKTYTITITRASAASPGEGSPGGGFTPTTPPTTSPATPPAISEPPVVSPDAPANMTDTAGHWGKEAIDYVISRGLFAGTSDTTFLPNAQMTRAMVWTVLARLDGQDITDGGTWYSTAQTWAAANGISDGTAPQNNVTREQLVAILYRYAGSPVANRDLNGFTDAGQVSDWASPAMQWAVQNGLIVGSGNALNPQGDATRTEVATILMRYIQLIIS